MALEDFVHRRRIADVDLVMLIARQTRPQLIPCFSDRGFPAKKLPAIPITLWPSRAKRLTVSEPIKPAAQSRGHCVPLASRQARSPIIQVNWPLGGLTRAAG